MAGNAAELKLNVTLDLAFFRGQLANLAQVTSGYRLPINVSIDRRGLQNELNALGANIRRRNYRLTIETNLSAEIAKAETLARKLGELGGKLKTGSSGFATSPQGAAGLMEYMQSQGLSGAGGFVGVGRSARLKNALEELTVKQLQGLAKSESITGASRLKKSALIDKLMNDLSQQAMENILGNAQLALRRFEAQYKGPIGPLPTGSKEPWARGSRGMYGGAGYEPYMATRQQPLTGFAAMPGIAGVFGAPGFALQPSLPGMAYQMAKPSVGSIGQFPTAGMMGPSTPLTINARTSMFAGGGGRPPGGGGGGGFFQSMGFGPSPQPINFDIFNKTRVPLSGAIQELSSEFANATKQVLLFGTAYKALAFFMDLPNQAFQAAKSLATYKNQLQAVTSETGTFEQSFAFVDNLATRFNVPLESARQGFVKLYASMQPAGFSQGQIEGLFTGISKAAAAFGLSSDKVDRVNYAFAQMASKGQIMSEELKGQLGDVLPGALGLFAQAAQMSIPEFSKAMEDGAFKGKAMQQVLDNVAVLMNDKFGPAAQGAAKTLQGAVNQMQNNLKIMYESMSPIVNQFATAFSGPINSLIQDVAKSIQLLTSNVLEGSDAVGTLSPRAQEMYSVFQQLGPSIANAASNLGTFFSSLQVLISPLVAVTKGLLDILAIPFVARIGLYATIITGLNGAFQLLARTGLIQAAIAMTQFAVSLNIAQINVYIAGIQTVIAVLRSLITTANLAKLAIMGVKVALVSFGVGVALLAFDAIAQRILNIGDAAESAKKSTRELAQELDNIASSGNIEAATKQYLDANTKLVLAQRKNQQALTELRDLQQRAGRQSGEEPWAVKEARMRADQTYSELLQARRDVQAARQTRASAIRIAEQQRAQTQSSLQKVDLSAGGDGQGRKLQPYDRSQLEAIQRRFEADKRVLDAKLRDEKISKLTYEIEIARLKERKEREDIEESYRLKVLETNRDNLSASDKELKLFDLKKAKTDELLAAEERRKDAIKKATLEIRSPFKDALRDVNNEIDGQEMRLSNLRSGYIGLTAEQEAQLFIQEKTKGLKADEYRAIQDTIGALQEQVRIRIENNRLIEQETNLASLRAQIGVAGAGLGAGFIGEAGGAFEKALLESQGNVDYAMQMARLTEQLSLLKLNADLTRQSIEGIGGAFATTLVDGSMALAEGSKTAQEVFADFLRSIAKILADAAKQIIATYIAIGIARMFAGIGGGGGGGGLEAYTPQGNAAFMERTGALGFANGGIVMGGFKAFADGGVVTGPTLGLVGEGRYNEAIIPMPNGRSVPVDLQGATGGNTNVVVNVDAKGSAASGDDTRANALGRVIANALQEEIIRQKRPGGLLTQ